MSAGRSVVLVAGARPNFVKVAALLPAFARVAGPFTPFLVHMGQHRDPAMSDVFFAQLGIRRPDLALHVECEGSVSRIAAMAAAFEAGIGPMREITAGVVVVGDVDATLAAALGSVRLGLKVAHVEAGLRSFDRSMPEENNRLVIDALSSLHFVSEPSGRTHLVAEGTPTSGIHDVGNVMIDTLVCHESAARALLEAGTLQAPQSPYAYVTLHRPSNVDDVERLTFCVRVIERVASSVDVVFPVHPRTRASLERHGLYARLSRRDRVHMLSPQGYLESLALLMGATFALTDSGGIQEESTFLQIPCLTLRTNTERPITVTAGTNCLIGSDAATLEARMGEIVDGRFKRATAIAGWDGAAARRIVAALATEWT